MPRTPDARVPWLSDRALSCLSVLLVVAGCAAPSRSTIRTFGTPPADWLELSAARSGETAPLHQSLRVDAHRLFVSGTRVIVDPVILGDFRGFVDVALVGENPRGFAGVVLAAADHSEYHVLAIRSNGDWRHYKTDRNPHSPVSGRGWQRPTRENVAGFWRLGVELRRGQAEFSIDGQPVAQAAITASRGSSEPAAASWRAGILTHEMGAYFNNFIFGENSATEPFEPEDRADWGSRSDAARLLKDFQARVRAFSQSPSRQRILTLVADLQGALYASGQNGETDLRDEVLAAGQAAAASLRQPASRVGESKLLVNAFRDLTRSAEARKRLLGLGSGDPRSQMEEAERAGHVHEALVHCAVALEVQPTPELEERFELLRRKVPRLTYRFDVDTSRAQQTVVSARALTSVVHESYGGLEQDRSAELVITCRVLRSRVDLITEKASRKVAVTAGGKALPDDLENELTDLESRFPEELVEAQAAADVQRTGREVLGPSTIVHLRPYQFGDKRLELVEDDGRRLKKMYERLVELRRRRNALGAVVREETIPAERRTLSVVAEIAFSVSYRGRVVVNVERDQTYSGLLEWRHPARPDIGVEASSFDKARERETLETVRRRVLAHFRNGVSRESVVSRLTAEEKLPFLLLSARETRQPDWVASLQWQLQEGFGLEGVLRDRVAARLLR